MTDLSTPELMAVGVAVTMAYTVFGFGGFGANLVSLPLLAHVMSLRFAVPMLLTLDLFSATVMGVKNRKLIQKQELLRLLPWMLLGMLAGLVVLKQAQEHWLLVLLGSFVLANGLWNLFGRQSAAPIAGGWARPAGLVGGVFSTLFGTGGPVYTLFLARRLTDTQQLRASVGALILGSALVRLVMFSSTGLMNQPGLFRMALTLVPCALLGYLIGSRLQARLPQALVRRVIWGLLVVSGASLLWRGLMGR